MDGDKHALAYVWRPEWDYVLMGAEEGGTILPRLPMGGEVFVVLVMPEPKPESSGVWGTVEHWSWVRVAGDLHNATVDWQNRYDQKLWSKVE